VTSPAIGLPLSLSSASCPETGFIRDSRFQQKFPHHTNTPCFYRALSDLFFFAVLSGNAAWRRSFLAREREEEGEWDEWEGGGHTKKRGPTFPLLPKGQGPTPFFPTLFIPSLTVLPFVLISPHPCNGNRRRMAFSIPSHYHDGRLGEMSCGSVPCGLI
jgi:hypothetical protein